MRGLALHWKILIGMVFGVLLGLAGSAGESTDVATSPSRIPMIIPIRIFQCSASPRINLSTISRMFLHRFVIDGRLRGR